MNAESAPVVMIYRLGSLGDTIVALPAIRLVARAFPLSRRVLLTNAPISDKAASPFGVLAGTGLVDAIVEYPLKMRNWREILAARRRIRAVRPDVLVYLAPARGRLNALRDAAFFWFCGIRRMVGVPVRRRLQASLAQPGGMYEYEGARLVRSLAALGPHPIDDAAFDLRLTAAEREAAKTTLAGLGGLKILAFSIGTKTDVSDWGDAKWRALLVRLAASLSGWGLVAVGAASERARTDALMAPWPGPKVNACGALDVRVSGAVLAQANVFLGHDSGPMHLAAAVGMPCVAVFSARSLPGVWFPPGTKNKNLYHTIACQGCRLFVCVARAKACINAISVDEVFEALEAVVKLG
jgi:ADP-heptose:LPS heptosyltransferase